MPPPMYCLAVWQLQINAPVQHRADDGSGFSSRGCIVFDKVLFLVALACTAAPMLGAAAFILTLAQ